MYRIKLISVSNNELKNKTLNIFLAYGIISYALANVSQALKIYKGKFHLNG